MTGPDMIAKWLTGYGYTEGLLEYVQQFPEAKYDGMIYRGMFFDHYPDMKEIRNSEFCSWSTDMHVAEYFASHAKYGFVLSKKSTGYDVHKILEILKERNELPEKLKGYRKKASELEVFDCLDVKKIRVRRFGLH